MRRRPPDILITTPESLYLMLTSAAREMLRRRRDRDRRRDPRPGADEARHPSRPLARAARAPHRRTIRSASASRRPSGRSTRSPASSAATGAGRRSSTPAIGSRSTSRSSFPCRGHARAGRPAPGRPPASRRQSIWPAIHPRLLELIRAHRSTLIFVNSRRLAERLAQPPRTTLAERGDRSRPPRLARARAAARDRGRAEDRPAAGARRHVVARARHRHGRGRSGDPGRVAGSVSRGLQRIGRAGHQVGGASRGMIFPKYRGDLLEAAVVVERMREGEVEQTRVPAQPARRARAADRRDGARWTTGPSTTSNALVRARRARSPSSPRRSSTACSTCSPAATRPTSSPSCGRASPGTASPAPSAAARGRAAAGRHQRRHHPRPRPLRRVPAPTGPRGSASSTRRWSSRPLGRDVPPRRDHLADRGDHPRPRARHARARRARARCRSGTATARAGRSSSAGDRRVRRASSPSPRRRRDACRPARPRRAAADNLLAYLADQAPRPAPCPTDRAIVVERFRDELGDWRVCVLSPFGGRVHAPWAHGASSARWRERSGIEVETLWTDDGIVVRFPTPTTPPTGRALIRSRPTIWRISLVDRARETLALRGALPRERRAGAAAAAAPPGQRTPLWQQRERAPNCSRSRRSTGSFPIMLETYRECLRDVFDLPALVEPAARDRSARDAASSTVDPRRRRRSPRRCCSTTSATFIYEGDARWPSAGPRRSRSTGPAARALRRRAARAARCRGDRTRSRRSSQRRAAAALDADGTHDLLRRLGDLSRDELAARGAADVDGSRRSAPGGLRCGSRAASG